MPYSDGVFLRAFRPLGPAQWSTIHCVHHIAALVINGMVKSNVLNGYYDIVQGKRESTTRLYSVRGPFVEARGTFILGTGVSSGTPVFYAFKKREDGALLLMSIAGAHTDF